MDTIPHGEHSEVLLPQIAARAEDPLGHASDPSRPELALDVI